MSLYKNRWASCEHGKRNQRVCVECWDNSRKLAFQDGELKAAPNAAPTGWKNPEEFIAAAAQMFDVEASKTVPYFHGLPPTQTLKFEPAPPITFEDLRAMIKSEPRYTDPPKLILPDRIQAYVDTARDSHDSDTGFTRWVVPAKVELQFKNALESNFAKLMGADEKFRKLPVFGPAIDRRDHEWQPRVKTPTFLNLIPFKDYPWRTA